MITVTDLKSICPLTKSETLAKYVEPLNDAMAEYDINNPEREAMFLAQVAHESGGFHYVRELATGGAYEGRVDLGNTQPGDGIRYKGRGLIQITGRANYKSCGDALGENLIDMPELLEQPELACRSAAWFWSTKKLNEIADQDTLEAFIKITKRVNGGTNGLADRQAYLVRAQAVLC